MRISVTAVFLLLSFIFITIPASATVWQAYDDATLEKVLSDANQNDIIYLNPGTYTVAVNLNKQGLSLVGMNADSVLFDLSGSNLKMSAQNCLLQGVTVINSSRGVEVKASGCEIAECVFEGLTYSIGINIQEDNTLFRDNIVSNCTGSLSTVYGLGDDCTYTGNTFINNTCAGLYLYYSGGNDVYHNSFQMNTYGIDISSASGGNKIYLNDFAGNDEAIIADDPPSISWRSPDIINYTYNNTNYSGYLGNYWGGYNASDADEDGILDTEYTVPHGAGTDAYPLAVGFQNYTGTGETDPADLVITPFSVSSLVAHQPNRVRVNVSNIGGEDAGSFKVVLYNGDDPVGEEVILSLGAGNSTQVAFTLLPSEGEIDLRAVADTENNIAESEEYNNELTDSVMAEAVETDENWFQFHKDVEHTGFYPGEGPDDSTLLWVSDYINAVGSSTPVIAEGTVFVNCGDSGMDTGPEGDEDDSVIGLDMYTGEVLGSFGPGSTSSGSWASPCYYNGSVYCGRDDSTNGGDMFVNGKRYVGDYDGSHYYCTYENNGTQIWSFSVRGFAQCVPAYSDGMVYLAGCEYQGSGDFYCVDAETGELIWHIHTPREIDGTASVYNDVLYFTTYNWDGYGDIYAIDKYDGTVLWRNTIQRTDSCPAVAYGNVYVCGGCFGYSYIQTYCFDAVTGDTVWETVASGDGVGGWTCSPLVADGKVYAGKIDSSMYSYSAVYAFDAYDGDQLWTSSGGGATPAMSEGILYTIGNDGKVYAYGSLSGPHADFLMNATSGEAPLIVSFTDVSESNITAWQWDFDNDGIIDSTEQNPVHAFSSVGDYTVSLKVTNTEGTDTETKIACITVTDNGGAVDWNPWDDPSSSEGSIVTTSELQEAVDCWVHDRFAPGTTELITTERLQALVDYWIAE